MPCAIPKRKFNSEPDSLAPRTQSSRIQHTIHYMSYDRNAKGPGCSQKAILTLFGESQNCHLDLVLMGKESLPKKEKDEGCSRQNKSNSQE